MNFADKFAAYSVAKFAVFRLWDHLSFNHPEMSVFHIQPGIVDTAMDREAGGIKATGTEYNVSLPGWFNVWLDSPEARFLNGKFVWTNWDGDVDKLKAQVKELEAGSRLSIGLVG
ncbi:hypothetical protein AJ79_09597 [Helicocarpus griseus UAMH5409]|uniref:Uncharacterized protein n=1 Tax=Helicocarpus griseus UAMH5409 TaxID=1447875 RepID=A0A2B7WIG1_9EURO|nr:hypothetical protein AJ79_09597 [Helicocarpus griseus UAMH5409]